ncbi:MAG: 50S ribosomal protein L6 [Gammaproteobacteria bacterium RIFCSPHIGHO2_12_FULL_37_34]|nr:MAG: 50S ribosomal protein L6 [Gammaproteobacteria bacterium RIFCSPHIGHO2_12_FULL_37_34]
MTTSRIGRKPVVIPSGVDIKIQDQTLSAKGPKGQLSIALHPFVQVTMKDGHINLQHAQCGKITGLETKLYRSIVGTARATIQNVIHGITHGFERRLALVGVGYRAQAKGKILSLSLGFSHPTDFVVPEGVVVETPTQTDILIKGIDKRLVGQVAAKIRSIRKPEPYKGKGVRYTNEIIELKETKKK